MRLAIGCVVTAMALLPARALERRVEVVAPATAPAGGPVAVVLYASTDAGQGERIGLFQADYSLDGGKTWTGLCYLDNIGTETRQDRTITAGGAGTVVKIRLRVAFRGGLAGDVDYTGTAIRWNAAWGQWREPPAKSAGVTVK